MPGSFRRNLLAGKAGRHVRSGRIVSRKRAPASWAIGTHSRPWPQRGMALNHGATCCITSKVSSRNRRSRPALNLWTLAARAALGVACTGRGWRSRAVAPSRINDSRRTFPSLLLRRFHDAEGEGRQPGCSRAGQHRRWQHVGRARAICPSLMKRPSRVGSVPS